VYYVVKQCKRWYDTYANSLSMSALNRHTLVLGTTNMLFTIPSTISPQASSPLSHHGRTEGQISTPLSPLLLSFFHRARGALPAGATLLGWPNYGVDGRLNEFINASPETEVDF